MNEIRAFYPVSESIATSGQPSAQQFADIARAGYSVVINLALPTSDFALPDERGIVEALGMTYVAIPVPWDAPQIAHLQQFTAAMQQAAQHKVWVHCALNMRVSCFMYLYRLLVLGVPEDEARYPMSQIWQPDGVWANFIDAATAR